MNQIRILCLLITILANCYSQVFFPNWCQPCGPCGGCCNSYPNYPFLPNGQFMPNYPIYYPYPLYPSIHNRPTFRPNIIPTRTTTSKVVSTAATHEENVITTPTPSQQATTPCPAVSAPPNRCPDVGNPSYNDCQNYKRIFPNPITCRDSSDCPEPFNTCCQDSCFETKICKTYLRSFEN
ncbi:hypothetical protein RN001_013319 [Aquatica leii]|uniref:WAP domain-containing protein n=1 Tax=Aquatica leii TaxID=1421715 RepID=A0AAN7SDT9_9COLE|nr:hypothetical protein RN001_013319 [Aquatica leii]